VEKYPFRNTDELLDRYQTRVDTTQMPEHTYSPPIIPLKPVTECQIFITRKCNILCGYCKLTRKHFENELSINEWKLAFKNLEKIGIKTVKILGGEPTVIDGLEELLKFINENTSIKYAILSNSIFSQKKLENLINIRLQGYFASVDGIEDIKSVNGSIKKSHAGFKRLLELKEKGIKILGANVVINKQNILDIPEIVKSLSNEGIWVNLCPVIHGKQDFWEFRTDVPLQYKFTKNDIPVIDTVMKELVTLKHAGYKIAVPDSYLLNMSKYCINLNWKCNELVQLRIDSDGALTICNDIRGKVADKYNILHIDDKIFNRFKIDWYNDKDRINCPGCYWSCFLSAQENIYDKKLEFDYALC